MGGLGSGRHWYYDAQDTTDDYRYIDVRRWQRDGFIRPGRAFGWQWTSNNQVTASIQVRVDTGCVWLSYRHRSGGGEWKDEHYPVYLDWTSCHLGGQRPWFRCPAIDCKRRVAILYGGSIFACRHCFSLSYPSQRENTDGRARLRADRIRAKLGWEPGILNPNGTKPKGMHWKTFERLFGEYNGNIEQSLAGMALRFGFKR